MNFRAIIDAYSARERDGAALLRESVTIAGRLLERICALADAPEGASVEPAPLMDSGATDLAPICHGMVDDWYQVRLRFRFPSSETAIERTITVRLRFRMERNARWAIRFHERDRSRYFIPSERESVDAVCHALFKDMVAWLKLYLAEDLRTLGPVALA